MSSTPDRQSGQLEYPYGQATSDEEVLSAVMNALHHNSGVPHEGVRVEAKNGHVVLTGVVAQEFERSLAEQAAATAPGVTQVTNQITLAS